MIGVALTSAMMLLLVNMAGTAQGILLVSAHSILSPFARSVIVKVLPVATGVPFFNQLSVGESPAFENDALYVTGTPEQTCPDDDAVIFIAGIIDLFTTTSTERDAWQWYASVTITVYLPLVRKVLLALLGVSPPSH